jgi:hypothetical protein
MSERRNPPLINEKIQTIMKKKQRNLTSETRMTQQMTDKLRAWVDIYRQPQQILFSSPEILWKSIFTKT